jgi:hypothetical protein
MHALGYVGVLMVGVIIGVFIGGLLCAARD